MKTDAVNILIDWDFDGTIANTETDWYYILKEYLLTFFKIPTHKLESLTEEVYFKEFSGLSMIDFIEKATTLGFISKQQLEHMPSKEETEKFILDYFSKCLQNDELLKKVKKHKYTTGTYELINKLEASNVNQHITSAAGHKTLLVNAQVMAKIVPQGKPNAIAEWISNNNVISCHDGETADNQDILKKLNKIYTNNELNYCKPSPIVHILSLLKAIKDGKHIEKIIIPEDSTAGVSSGHNLAEFLSKDEFAHDRQKLGIKDNIKVIVVGYLCGQIKRTEEELLQSGADLVIKIANDLKKVIF